MPELLPRYRASLQRVEDERKIGRILLESEVVDAPATVARATLAGDRRRLRGVPCVARGVSGTAPGTDPVAELIRKGSTHRRA